MRNGAPSRDVVSRSLHPQLRRAGNVACRDPDSWRRMMSTRVPTGRKFMKRFVESGLGSGGDPSRAITRESVSLGRPSDFPGSRSQRSASRIL